MLYWKSEPKSPKLDNSDFSRPANGHVPQHESRHRVINGTALSPTPPDNHGVTEPARSTTTFTPPSRRPDTRNDAVTDPPSTTRGNPQQGTGGYDSTSVGSGAGPSSRTHGAGLAVDQSDDREQATSVDGGQHPADEPQVATTSSNTDSLQPGHSTDENAEPAGRSWTRSIVINIFSVAVLLAATYLASLPLLDTEGLSSSRQCGFWSLRSGAKEIQKDDDDWLVQAPKEFRASQYARDCYGRQSAASDPRGCDFFARRQIPYFTGLDDTNQQYQPVACPFEDDSLCPDFIAQRFSTGRVSSEFIGINSPNAPEFNRTTICVPLDMKQLRDRGLVVREELNSTFPRYQYWYKLGPKHYEDGDDDGDVSYDYTYKQRGDPYSWNVASYKMSIYPSSPYKAKSYWTPIPGLNPKESEGRPDMAIMFISPCHIKYTGSCDDYVFGAHRKLSDDTFQSDNAAPTPIVCIDWTEVCPKDERCRTIEHDDKAQGYALEYVRQAVGQSTTYSSIKFGLGARLRAQEEVGDWVSLRLQGPGRENEGIPTQWIIETEAMFAASLARIQYDALDIAGGFDANRPDYESDLPSWAQDNNLCGMFKFHLPAGHVNISLFRALILIVIGFFIWLGSNEFQPFEEEKYRAHFGKKAKWMGFEYPIFLLSRLPRAWKRICRTARGGSQVEADQHERLPINQQRLRDATYDTFQDRPSSR